MTKSFVHNLDQHLVQLLHQPTYHQWKQKNWILQQQQEPRRENFKKALLELSKSFFCRTTTKATTTKAPVTTTKAPVVIAKKDDAKEGYDYPKPAVKFDLPKYDSSEFS